MAAATDGRAASAGRAGRRASGAPEEYEPGGMELASEGACFTELVVVGGIGDAVCVAVPIFEKERSVLIAGRSALPTVCQVLPPAV